MDQLVMALQSNVRVAYELTSSAQALEDLIGACVLYLLIPRLSSDVDAGSSRALRIHQRRKHERARTGCYRISSSAKKSPQSCTRSGSTTTSSAHSRATANTQSRKSTRSGLSVLSFSSGATRANSQGRAVRSPANP